ncbi:Fc.00g018730.m01.CDS01 [Cosmosporella sp. VM-42]
MSTDQQATSPPASEDVAGASTSLDSSDLMHSTVWEDVSNSSFEEVEPVELDYDSCGWEDAESVESLSASEATQAHITPSGSRSGWDSETEAASSISGHTDSDPPEMMHLERARSLCGAYRPMGVDSPPVYSNLEPWSSQVEEGTPSPDPDQANPHRCQSYQYQTYHTHLWIKTSDVVARIFNKVTVLILKRAKDIFSPLGLSIIALILSQIALAALNYQAGWVVSWDKYEEHKNFLATAAVCDVFAAIIMLMAIMGMPTGGRRPETALYPLLGIIAFSIPAILMTWDNVYRPIFWYFVSFQAGLLVAFLTGSFRDIVNEDSRPESSAV